MAMTAEALHPREFDHQRGAYDDESTWFAETLSGSMRTRFEYDFDGRELYGRDGRALTPIFDRAIKDAEQLIVDQPELFFEPGRRLTERGELDDMLAMARGEGPNTMIVESDFPEELTNAMEDVGGYNVKRRQTMLRVITRVPNGRLSMTSQTLDGSDRTALEAIYAQFGYLPRPGELLGQRIRVDVPEEERPYLVDRLMGVYDRSLSAQYGGKWYAGRPGEAPRNTYDFVMRQRDLLEMFVEAKLRNSAEAEWLRYDIAAALQKRFKSRRGILIGNVIYVNFGEQALWDELTTAGAEARAQGLTFSGCGESVAGSEADTEEQLGQAGYGNKVSSSSKQDCEFTSKMCPVCKDKNVRTKVSGGIYYHVGKGCKAA